MQHKKKIQKFSITNKVNSNFVNSFLYHSIGKLFCSESLNLGNNQQYSFQNNSIGKSNQHQLNNTWCHSPFNSFAHFSYKYFAALLLYFLHHLIHEVRANRFVPFTQINNILKPHSFSVF